MRQKLNNFALSLVVPVYNEKEIIAETVDIFLRDLSEICAEYELIIVDDASTDGTGLILDRLKEKYPGKLVVIKREKNVGAGRCLLSGFAAAGFPFIATNFADRPFDLKELRTILPMFGPDVDFIVVCRKDRSANNFYRKITSLVNYALIRLLFGVKVRDFQFVQIYRKKVLAGLKVKARHTFVPPEIIIRARDQGFCFREYETDFYPREKGKAKCGHPAVIITALWDMTGFFFARIRESSKPKKCV